MEVENRSSLQIPIQNVKAMLRGGSAVLFGALGAWAATVVPNPALKAIAAGGFGLLGLYVDWQISDTGVADALASQLTNAFFNGAEALGMLIVDLVERAENGLDIFSSVAEPMIDFFNVELESNGTWQNVDGNTENGNELNVAIYHTGLGSSYLFSTNPNWNPGAGWSGGTGPDPDGPPLYDEPVGSAFQGSVWHIRSSGEMMERLTYSDYLI